ncbi:iron donor protein CyaY [Orbaceae bacterium ESL0721]|nr:iron donor protein CyaY [Orbaceae bacterium ESL0721]
MDANTFYSLTDQLFNSVESFLDNYADEHNIDIDYDIHGNVITIAFTNGSKIILNTQEPLFQIWLATSKQGYHFDYLNGDWICNRTDKSFNEIFTTAVAEQAH